MIKMNISKKLSVIVLAFGLATTPVAPSVCTMAAEQAATDSAAPEENQGLLEITTKTYRKTYKTKDGLVYKKLSFEYPVAAGDSDAANTFNQNYKDIRASWMKSAKKDLKEAEEFVKQIAANNDERYYSDDVTCQITNNDKKYISIFQSGYEYSLGAHGMPYRITRIMDAKTGETVSAAELLGLTSSQLNAKVVKLYLKKYDKTLNTDDFPFYENRSGIKKTLKKIDFNQNQYYLKNGKIRFYTYPYAVGPYAAGFVEVAVKL